MSYKKHRKFILAAIGSSLSISLLSACSGEAPQNEAPLTHTEQQEQGTKISNPKDLNSVPPCNLLTPEAAISLGVEPEGRPEENEEAEDEPACAWGSEDLNYVITLGPLNQSIDLYRDSSSFSDYQEMEIAGYPAVCANKGNPDQDGYCSIFLATSDNQLLHAFTRDSSHVDPCGLAQRTLEKVVPDLPTAK